jgi:hypothetical protein
MRVVPLSVAASVAFGLAAAARLPAGGWHVEGADRRALYAGAAARRAAATGPDGNSHICAGKSGMFYCFIGGSPKS